MATRLVPQLWQVLDANGNPGNGFKLYFYATGTSNLKNTYSDTALSVANANPVICNSDGHPANVSGDPIGVWGVNKEDYKVILKDASDNIILTEDPIDTVSYDINSFGARPTQHWGITTNTADAYQIKPVPSITQYSSDLLFSFTPHLDNNADCTFAVFQEGTESTYLSALTMKKYDMNGAKVNLEALDLQAGQTYLARIDTTDVVVLNPDKPKFRNATINELLQVNKILNLPSNSQTISSGVLTVSSPVITVVGEGDVADTITSFSVSAGTFFILRNDNVYDITLTYSSSIYLSRTLDIKLSQYDRIVFYADADNEVIQISRDLINDFRSGSGYEYLPNNKLRQYGKYAGGAFAPTITFPIAYDSAPPFVCGNVVATNGQMLSIRSVPSTTSFVGGQHLHTDAGQTSAFYWEVIGTKAQ
jgi:hypothetical protein